MSLWKENTTLVVLKSVVKLLRVEFLLNIKRLRTFVLSLFFIFKIVE